MAHWQSNESIAYVYLRIHNARYFKNSANLPMICVSTEVNDRQGRYTTKQQSEYIAVPKTKFYDPYADT